MSRFSMHRKFALILTMVTATLISAFIAPTPGASREVKSAITINLGGSFYVIVNTNQNQPPISYPGTVHNVPGDYSTISAAIQAAGDGDTILVDDGTYYEDLWVLGEDTKTFNIVSQNGPEKTIIYGTGTNSVVTFSDNSKSVLEGFTITNGYNVEYGGGILCGPGSAPEITNCIISNNSAGKSGGGIHVAESSSPVIENCTITGNSTIGATESSNGGGAQVTTLATPIFKNCIFSSNTSSWIAGAVAVVESEPQFINCVFVDNTAVQYAGAMAINYATPQIINCTFRGNKVTASDGRGGAIAAKATGEGTKIVNSIFWENSESTRANDIRGSENTIVDGVSYCLLDGGYEGTGNISGDPLFLDGSRYLISDNSPAIDQGTTTDAPDVDIEYEARPQRNGIDIGADEVP